MKRIGITMRVVQASGYDEPRDALAHDWIEFMATAFDDVGWMPIPNLGTEVIDYIQNWGINAFIFSGGNDIGTEPLRDTTEKVILDYAIAHKMSVFGVCRGLQFLQNYCGGELQACRADQHVAKTHSVTTDQGDQIVNSYHNFGVRVEQLNSKLSSMATTVDGWVEGVQLKGVPIQAVMWHPERDKPYRETDIQLMRDCLLQGVFK